MSGIAGWLDRYEDLSEKTSILQHMSKQLKRRGPDGDGIFIDRERGIALLHRRLTVIDPNGNIQPMTKTSLRGKYTLVYDGELYNTEELRQELIKEGYGLESNSDTEVLLVSYMHWGEHCLERLNGAFSFALWDQSERKLFMARDRIGLKPLFYYEYKGGLIFGSEIKCLLANPLIKPQIDEQGLSELFFVGPGRSSGYGIFKNIKELLPGECATYKSGVLKKTTYYSLVAKPHTDSVSQTIEKTRYLLQDSIRRQLVSDVPLCCFLSGGLDSSIITKVGADYYKEKGKGALNTFSVDYQDNQKYFETSVFQPTTDNDYIKIMSDFIGSNHKEVVVDNTKLFETLLPAMTCRDLPGMADVDSSLLLFAQAAKKEFTVGLSGECADELFGGYPWYHNQDILFEPCFPWARNLSIRRSILKDGLLPHGEDYVSSCYELTVNRTDKLPDDSALESRMREMFMLNFSWFMQGLLDRSDRMSMYSGFQVRCPFCDYRLVDYAYNMPWSIKALDGREKGILRTAMDGLLPDEIVWRKKSPYPKTYNPLYLDLVSKGAKAVLKDKDSVVSSLLSKEGVMDIIHHPDGISSPWYGQLMKAPQILAYIIQLDFWFKTYKPEIIGI